MVEFEYFIKKKLVKRRRRDIQLAKSLLRSAKDRFDFALSILKQKPRYALESAYEAVIELLESLLALEGFKSRSHEASIAFLHKLKEFSRLEVERLNVSRIKRHSSKYYGVSFTIQEAEGEIEFLKEIFKKLVKILESKIPMVK